MRVPIAWLREYVDLPADTSAIADRLAMLGFPVEDIEMRPVISGVVVGKIVELGKHPNADRLAVASVDVAGGKPLTIATAATNVALGQVIPVATIGARLPLLTIERRKMRGIESEGMMISADELALPADWFEDGIMQLEADVAFGTDIVELFGLNDAVLEVEVTSNRVDAMSMIGLARELAASYDVPLRLPPMHNPGVDAERDADAPQVSIETPDCTRFVAQRFESLAVAPAPAWMRVRLALAGQRPINNVVDVSNYVMLETGQPLHFYDASAVSHNTLIVRDARQGEELVTLDGATRSLSPQSLVIADDRGPLGLAGVMGGAASEVRETTSAIVLEAANFNGARVRRTSKAFALRSEASSRHEKALAPALTDVGAARAAQLLVALGAKAYRPHAFGEPLVPARPIALRVTDVARLLGLMLPAPRIARHLEALGCETTLRGEDQLEVRPPAWRRDLAIATDLVEEVARMEGYENIEAVVPSVPAHEISSAQYDLENQLAAKMSALGYNEIISYSLQPAETGGEVEVLNPLSEEQRVLRRSLAPALLEYFAASTAPVRVFEIGHAFEREDAHINERSLLSFAFSTEPAHDEPWRDSHFLRLKGDCEALLRAITGRTAETLRDVRDGLHPGKTAVMMIDGREVAQLGRVDPRLERSRHLRLPAYVCTVSIDKLPDYNIPRYVPPSKFPSTYRDLALVVDLDVTAAEVEETIARSLGELCSGVRVFDEYRGPQVGEGRKSLAVRITLQRYDATLTDQDADAAIGRALTALHDERGATIRE